MDDGAIALKNETSTISLKQKGVFLGAEITGVDLTQPLDDATIAAIGQAHA